MIGRLGRHGHDLAPFRRFEAMPESLGYDDELHRTQREWHVLITDQHEEGRRPFEHEHDLVTVEVLAVMQNLIPK